MNCHVCIFIYELNNDKNSYLNKLYNLVLQNYILNNEKLMKILAKYLQKIRTLQHYYEDLSGYLIKLNSENFTLSKHRFSNI